MGNVCNKRRKVANRHAAVKHNSAAEKDNGDNGKVHKKGGNRLHKNYNAYRRQPRFFKVGVGVHELFGFGFFAYKGFYNPYVGNAFLNGGIKTVYFCLKPLKPRKSHADNKPDCDKHNGNGDGENNRQLRFHKNGHNKSANHHAGGTKRHAKKHVNEILKLGNVVRKAGDKRTRRKAVDVFKRKFLYLGVNVLAQIGGEVNGGLCAEIGSANASRHHYNGKPRHKQRRRNRVSDRKRAVVIAVNYVGHKFWHKRLAYNLNYHAKRP